MDIKDIKHKDDRIVTEMRAEYPYDLGDDQVCMNCSLMIIGFI